MTDDRDSLHSYADGVRGSPVWDFSPMGLGTVVLWADAQQILAASGAAVATWRDLSGNSSDLVQATAIRKPIFTLNAINGRPALFFDGVNTFLRFTGLVTAPLIAAFVTATFAAQPHTVFVVAKQAVVQAASGQSFPFHSCNSSTVNHRDEDYGIDGTTYHVHSQPSDLAQATAIGTNPCVFALRAGSGGPSSLDLYENQTLIRHAVGFGWLFDATVDQFQIGGGGPGGSSGFGKILNGYIGEIIVFNGALSDASVATAQAQLMSKWGI